jgi:tripartite-type tricarboxylate transporter receptor subunit TctC
METVMMQRRDFTRAVAALAGLHALGLAGQAQAQTLNKTVRILVGFPPGGSADLLARALAQQLTGYGAQVIVDNKPGAGGRIALEQLKNAEADGSVLAVTPASMMVVYPHIYRKLSYQPLQDFAPVGKIGAAQFVFTIGPQVPAAVKTLADFVAWAKANPSLATYGSSGAGSIPHFTGVALGKAAGIELTHVAYKGAAPAMTDLLGGQVAANVGVISNALPHIVSGKLRALAVSGPARSAALSDVPTVGEAGYRAAQAVEWFGVFLPAKASGEAVNRLHAAVRAALKAKPLQEALAKASFEVGSGESVKEFGQQFHTDLNRWGEVVKVSGFTPED